MSLKSLFRRSRPSGPAHTLYGIVVDQARLPRFFAELEVPDTVDGRFEMVSLHMFLVLRHIKAASDSTTVVAQELFDVMFDDMDLTLREMGAGDMGVGKRVKAMVQAFYGRVAAYERGLAAGEKALAEALRRNAYGTTEPSDASIASLARYVQAQDACLAEQDPAQIAAGKLSFGDLK